MIIYKNTKKRGFAVGGNQMTASNLAAAGTALAGLVLASVIGFGGKGKRSDSKKNKSKKKKRLLSLAMLLPLAVKSVKSAVSKIELDKVIDSVNEAVSSNEYDIEVVNAIPISSEEEVYEYIEENNV